MLKRIILILVVLACAAGGIWWLYDGKRQPSDLLTLYGNVDIRQVDVGFRVGGRVTELFKEEGNAVKTGERLARLDAKPYEEVFDQAAAQLSMQEIELRKMVAGYRTEDIEQARATLNGAQAVYANAASNLRRVERLRQQNAVSQQSLDEARASYGDALSRRNAAREQLQLMESGYRSEDVERQKAAVEAARTGKDVAVVCSGDSGVYGMAGLIYEVAQEYDPIEIEVVPGITAACGGAAVLGAPLTHDFAVVSLSDLLTPWEKITARLTAAAQADFVLCLYNPASHSRPDYLQRACDILLSAGKDPATVCGTVRNIGRAGEAAALLTLGELRDTQVDMFTTVFVGNSQTKVIGGKMVTPRGYLQRGE